MPWARGRYAPRVRIHVAIALGLVALTAWVFLPVREHGFVDYDDFLYIVHNPVIAPGLGVDSAVAAFRDPVQASWHPLTTLSLQLDRTLWGDGPTGVLLTNVALHAFATLLLYTAFVQLTGSIGRSAFVAALFGVHPLHVESVAWASERKDTLSALFWMLTLLAYAGYARRRSLASYALVFVSLGLGLLAKPMLVTLPLVLLLLDFWPLGRLTRPGGGWIDLRRMARPLVEKLPLLGIAGVVSVVTYRVQQAAGAMAYSEAYSFGIRVSNAVESYVVYVLQTFWPTRLAAFYPHPVGTTPEWQVVACGVGLGLVTGFALASLARRPYLAVGWLWYLGTLVPVIGLVQVGIQARADRYTYLPMIGLAIMIAWGLPALLSRGPRSRRALTSAAGVAIVALAGVARQQVDVWRDTETLFSHAIAVTGDNHVAHHRLGTALLNADRLEDALVHYEALIEIRPSVVQPRFEIANALDRAGRLDEAIAHYQQGVAVAPEFTRGHGFLGLALVRAGRFDEAIDPLENGIARYAASDSLQAGLARAYTRVGRPDDAMPHFKEALRLRPGQPELVVEAAWLLATCAPVLDPEAARILIEPYATRSRDPHPAALDTLAAAHAAAGRFEIAERIAAAALAAHRARGGSDDGDLERRIDRYRSGRAYSEPCIGGDSAPDDRESRGGETSRSGGEATHEGDARARRSAFTTKAPARSA
jgi:tetratricopeptide (TPR) repeat protein